MELPLFKFINDFKDDTNEWDWGVDSYMPEKIDMGDDKEWIIITKNSHGIYVFCNNTGKTRVIDKVVEVGRYAHNGYISGEREW